MPAENTKSAPFHPAFALSNIKNHIQITLETENVHYASWAELFLNTARAYDVADHIDPPKDAVIKKDEQWLRLDAIVKQWIYSTISLDLLHTILEPNATAQQAWDRLKDIFHDNKNSRAVFLEQQFSQAHMDNYPNISAYCQALKMLADQLANVGAPVSNNRLVLQLVAGLSEGYDGVATIIQQSDPLPAFYKARSMLTLEETRRNKVTSVTTDSALVVTNTNQNDNSSAHSSSNNSRGGNNSRSYNNKGRGGHHRGGNRGKNGGQNNGGNGSSNGQHNNGYQGRHNGRNNQQHYGGQQAWTWVPFSPATAQHGWTPPPCPYPTSGWTTPTTNRGGPSILGPRPQQAFIAQPNSFGSPPGMLIPTDIAAAMQTMTLQQPDENYYMDTGASSHMTSNQGTLSSYFNSSNNRSIIVGNGSEIPIRGYGSKILSTPFPPFILRNVLHVPNIIKNLVSVRQFTTDNHVSVEFDPFGFTVKDLRTGNRLMRCNNTGDLYPLISTTLPSPAQAPPQALTAVSSITWSQQVGVDCDETFSPVVKPATIRTVLSLAVCNKWSIHQLDVKNAFLHGNLAETVYMYQPPGFRDRQHPGHVCLLQKSLYGLKQAPRAWYHRFATYVATIGFQHSVCDHSLFIFRKGPDTAYLLLYVDDIILVTSSAALRERIIAQLRSEFAMTDLGPLNYFLGISAIRHTHGLFLHQRKYTEEILARANMTNCKAAQTPVDTKSKLSAFSGKSVTDPTLYRSLAGALQYLTFTRPDISYAVQQICLYMHDPREAHMSALKRVIRYLQGTKSLGIHITPSSSSTLTAYSDADWGGCPDTRRSTSGYCVYLGDNIISWSSKRQPTLSRSSAEAEYRGVANVVAESCWLRNLLLELGCPIKRATIVYCDNVSAIYLSCNPVNHQRTKHIEMDIHFVREKVALGQVKVLHVPSRFQYANIFTKGLPKALFNDFRSSLNVHIPPVSTAGV
ncbi:uncharacterized protein LOC141594577 [Silene latifolia]|uniref:uncharacterized protein LOC141594577 n=1 Tax=Silene latifolia TaxID=37657 RepID=UPI003D7844FC